MHVQTRFLKANKLFASVFLAFILSAFLYCCLFSQSAAFINLNFIHTRILDSFFIYYTFLGDGLFPVFLFIILLFARRYLLAIHILLAFLSSGIIAQVLKQFIHTPRPKTFFQPEYYSRFIEGITHGGWASFPSGHTATAFAIATVLALHARNKILGLVYLLMAIGVAYSRIYLGQHFPEDVLAGSLIGVSFATWIFFSVKQVKLFHRNIVQEAGSPYFPNAVINPSNS